MIYYIVTKENKVVCDGGGRAREFVKAKKARNFIDGHGLDEAVVVENLDEVKVEGKVKIIC